jgi:excisionase family DNA binding protein
VRNRPAPCSDSGPQKTNVKAHQWRAGPPGAKRQAGPARGARSAPRSGNRPATVRQLSIKQPDRGEGTVETYLSVAETAEYLNTSERFVRRLVAERRIAFHHVGRHSVSRCPTWIFGWRRAA